MFKDYIRVECTVRMYVHTLFDPFVAMSDASIGTYLDSNVDVTISCIFI